MKRFKRKQSGVTLLELMVSLGIGAILLTGLGVVYVTATQEDTVRQLRSELDEAARQIFSTMAREVSLAGFIDNFDGTTTTASSANKYGNKILVRSDNIKNLFNREKDEVTAISLLTGKKYMLPIQGSDTKLTVIYQVANSDDASLTDSVTGEKTIDYRSLSGAMEHNDYDGSRTGDDAGSGWGKNCINHTKAALIDNDGKKNEKGLFIKQDFVFDKDSKSFSCGMDNWDNNWKTKKNDGTGPSSFTASMKAVIGSKDNDDPTSVESMLFRYVVTDNEHKSTDEYTVAESVSGYYTDKVFTHEDVKNSDLGWGGVTGVEVCVVLAVSPTFSKKGKKTGILYEDLNAAQPTIPTCERVGDGANADFAADVPRPDNDNKFYARYVRTLSAHNALFLR